jgi:hypothetical protein
MNRKDDRKPAAEVHKSPDRLVEQIDVVDQGLIVLGLALRRRERRN